MGLLGACHNAYHDSVVETIHANQTGLKVCIDEAVRRNPAAKGEIELALEIAPSGKMNRVGLSQDGVKDPALRDCLIKHASTWQAQPTPDGKQVVEKYKFQVEVAH